MYNLIKIKHSEPKTDIFLAVVAILSIIAAITWLAYILTQNALTTTITTLLAFSLALLFIKSLKKKANDQFGTLELNAEEEQFSINGLAYANYSLFKEYQTETTGDNLREEEAFGHNVGSFLDRVGGWKIAKSIASFTYKNETVKLPIDVIKELPPPEIEILLNFINKSSVPTEGKESFTKWITE